MEENGLVKHFKVVGDSSRKLCIKLLSQNGMSKWVNKEEQVDQCNIADSANVENTLPVNHSDRRARPEHASAEASDTTQSSTLKDKRISKHDITTNGLKKKLDERILDEIYKSKFDGVTRKVCLHPSSRKRSTDLL